MSNYELTQFDGKEVYYTIRTKDYRVAIVVYNFLNTFDVLGKISLLSADDVDEVFTYEFRPKSTKSLRDDLNVLDEVIERILD